MTRVVVALGGNAILSPGQAGTFTEQLENVTRAVDPLADFLSLGHRLVITHGNGPQVGNLLIQQESARTVTPPLPLFACGAMTQGLLGLMIEQALHGALGRRGMALPVATVLTQVVVDRQDPAMERPEKPVGPFYTEDRARRLAVDGLEFREDAGRGFRRVVPSPLPRHLVNRDIILALLEAGAVVVAAGGGGVPVSRDPGSGQLQGVDAVIDKDRASCRLALEIGAEVLMILTEVPAAAVDFNTRNQRWLHRVTLRELEVLYEAGHFLAGSMGPKVQAAMEFVRGGGRRAVIAHLQCAVPALEGTEGTQVTTE